MRIALLNTVTPFIRGGAEILVEDLAHQLEVHGHDVVLSRLPFPPDFGAPLIATLEAARMLSFEEFDRVIAFKFPAYCIRHHAKVIWMFHQFRQIYDLWGHEHGLFSTPYNEHLRRVIKAADESDIPLARAVYTNAQEVSNRLKRFNSIDSNVLMPPLKDHERYFPGKTGDYIFYPSRITRLKRQHLAIEAMQYVQSGVRLVIRGVCEEEDYYKQLCSLINQLQLENRVILQNEWISDDEKRELFANALGAMYIPYQEDSCGFVSMEAFYSAKPVISCTDSGGTRELIDDGIHGYMVEPTPQGIAQAMDKLYQDKQKAEQMGKEALNEITRRDITWPSTLRRLLS